jgi:hypothetical protein
MKTKTAERDDRGWRGDEIGCLVAVVALVAFVFATAVLR